MSNFKKLNLVLALQYSYGKHRSGWKYALNSLKNLHDNNGILLDGFIEKKFVWGSDPGEFHNHPEPYQQPWLGFIHCPPNMPKWFHYNLAPQSIFKTELWQASYQYCQGLFCLSNYHKRWLQQNLEIPIINLLHPTEVPSIKFSLDKFLSHSQSQIIQIGWWLRKLNSIYYLPVKKIKKAILMPNRLGLKQLFEQEKFIFKLQPDYSSVEIIDYLSDYEYDILLSQNLVYLDLYDASATNTIIECIVRHTPVLVNPLPAVREYLGDDYPFYFMNREEAADKAENLDLIAKTYEYLRTHPIHTKLSGSYFRESLYQILYKPEFKIL
jgi:hypothetical protein